MTPAQAMDALARELAAFVDLLESEAAALAGNQADALEPLTARREQTNRRLAESWRNLTAGLGEPATATLESLRPRGLAAAPEAWRQVEELARQAERMNRLNSRLIDEQLRRTQTAVQVLRDAAGGRALYGADGQVSNLFNSNRSIDTA